MLRQSGVQRSIFNEVQSLASLAFRFKEKYPPSQYTSRLAGLMQHGYPAPFILSGPSLIREYNVDIINENLEYLRPDNFRIMVASQQPPNGAQFTMREKWYDTEYNVLEFSDQLKKVLGNSHVSYHWNLFIHDLLHRRYKIFNRMMHCTCQARMISSPPTLRPTRRRFFNLPRSPSSS